MKEARPVAEVFAAFLKLGLTSFGGPIAHLGYFRDELVLRRRWIDDEAYAELVALCQFLPGPASSQVGFVLGYARAGWPGAFAAFIAFTFPSALLMLALAFASAAVGGPIAEAALHGLKLVAVAIVGQAVWGMARSLTPDLLRAAIAIGAALFILLVGGAFGQVGAIALGAMAGLLLCRRLAVDRASRWLAIAMPRRLGVAAAVLFVALLAGLPPLAHALGWRELALFDIFYRAGALVFGGGHVILPLLQAELVPPGWIGDDSFLAGYGAAQALPGPLFAISAYLGTVAGNGVGGGLVALAALFLPGFLILTAALPFWEALRRNRTVKAAIIGVNAAVVGILGMALYDPLVTTAVLSWRDALLALAALVALLRFRAPPLAIVAGLVAASIAIRVAA